MAYFGYPQAHEDDAERAVRSALTAIEGVVALRTARRLQARIGIATGVVVTGEIGSGEAQLRGALGETPNLAARLQALADPSGIVICNATHQLIGALFDYRDLGLVELRGFPAPERVWQVLGEGAVESRFEALRPSSLGQLVGREEEVELITRRWSQAKRGNGRVVLLSGEPGIGKSRLTAALEEQIADELHTRIRYFCSSHHQDSPLHPVIAQLERACGFGRGDTPDTKLAKLEALLMPASPSAEEITLFAELLSIPLSEHCLMVTLSPQLKKERTFDALLHQLEALARSNPVLMVYEDVHWIDPSSRELLDLLVDRVRPLPVLVIVTFRSEFEPPWTGQAHVSVMVLNRLDQCDGAALVRGIAGTANLGDDLIREIIDRSDGVPLFVEEVTKAVLEGSASVAALPQAALAVPATLHASLMARLDRLGPAAKEVAQAGAVIGREFGYELLAAVTGRNQGELLNALVPLCQSGLLFQRGAPPAASFTFKHALVQEAAYSTLLRDRRRQLHDDVARALQERFSDRAKMQPEVVAHHLTEAGHIEPAMHAWLTAGRRSAERSAHREAIQQLRRGLDLLATLPEGVSRDRTELDLLIALGPPLFATFGCASDEVVTAFERAAKLCERLGDSDRLMSTLEGLFLRHMVAGQTKTAFEVLKGPWRLRERAAIENNVALHIGRWVPCKCSWDDFAPHEGTSRRA
jgi:hypothetical protein